MYIVTHCEADILGGMDNDPTTRTYECEDKYTAIEKILILMKLTLASLNNDILYVKFDENKMLVKIAGEQTVIVISATTPKKEVI